MVRVINLSRDKLPTQFKSSFQSSLRLQIISDTDNKVKLHVVMDLLAKTIITPPKIILNSEYLPPNLNSKLSIVVMKGIQILCCDNHPMKYHNNYCCKHYYVH